MATHHLLPLQPVQNNMEEFESSWVGGGRGVITVTKKHFADSGFIILSSSDFGDCVHLLMLC